MRRLIAFLLAAATVVALCGGVVAAPARIQVEKTWHVNPVHEGRLTEADLFIMESRANETQEQEVEYQTSASACGKALRLAMVQRQEKCQVYLRTEDYSKDRVNELMDEILVYALLHSGVGNEGDYLMWQFAGWSVRADGYEADGYGYMTFTYELMYYTNAQQEAQVDAKVTQILESLELEGKSQYQQACAIYDYICNNVTYDTAHEKDEYYDPQYTAYGALIDGTCNSQGYAVTLYRLALEAGLECHVLAGKVGQKERLWNILQVDDVFYNADASMDAGTGEYGYFLKSDASFADHVRDDVFASEDYHEFYPVSGTDYAHPCRHKYEAVVKVANCTDFGYTNHICTKCDHSYKTDYVFPTGHSYADGVCGVCNQAQISVPQIKSCYSQKRDSVKVTWFTQNGVDGYQLWRATDLDDPASWKSIKTVNAAATDRYTNQGLTEGVTYYYKVRAYVINERGAKLWSDFSEVNYMPAAVVFDSPYSNATYRIRLCWKEVGGSHGYQIWGLQENGTWKIVKTLGDKGNTLTNNQGGTTAYSNTGRVAGNVYTYRMRAFRITDDGKKVFGAYSQEYSVAAKPETPAVTVTTPKATRAQVSWNGVNGASGYQIWMATSAGGEYKIVKSVTDPAAVSYTKYDLESGKTYYFKVRAYVEVEGRKTFSAYSGAKSVVVK